MKHDLEIVTYIGSHRFKFYKNLQSQLSNLNTNLKDYNYKFRVYDNKDLRKLLGLGDLNNFYLFTRYGAGAWFWKPIIILDALELSSAKYLMYLDVDCRITKDPLPYLEEHLKLNSIALFKNPQLLMENISHRAKKSLMLESKFSSPPTLVTAGIVLVKNSLEARKELIVWSKAMGNPRVLLHPVITFKKEKHRHDQSVLSALISMGRVQPQIIQNGFFSKGPETLEKSIDKCWVYTGSLGSESEDLPLITRVGSILDNYQRYLYDFVKTLLIYPIHFLLFVVVRFLKRI